MVSAALQAATTERPDSEMRELLLESISASDSFSDRFEAEVWLSDMSNRLKRKVKDPEERFLILKTAHYEATRADLPPELVLALIDIESNFDRFAISHAGARGLMQVSIDTGVPISFGVLTTDNADQALARCGIKSGNKGREAATTALNMSRALRQLEDFSNR